MILPMSDVVGVAKHRSYRIGYSGFVVIIKGHEEIFFELPTAEQRDACMKAIEDQRDAAQLRRRQEKQAGDKEEDQHRELRELFDLSATRDADPSSPVMPHPQSEAVAEQPPIMFSSTTSDFVTFRPEKPLRFTCFTIGSRGDVQPYIALCKALMAQGHQCRIASHSEYQKWVEGHGIDFAPVGGDPAELMQRKDLPRPCLLLKGSSLTLLMAVMISHDFFTISFMKEAVSKFRGWLDELLDSAWKGCQGSDVIIESPSAIAGYHIAEALQIPYYRCVMRKLVGFLDRQADSRPVQCIHDAVDSNARVSPRFRCTGGAYGWRLQLHGQSTARVSEGACIDASPLCRPTRCSTRCSGVPPRVR